MNLLMNTQYMPFENLTWKLLISNRKKNLANEACSLYLACLDKLKLPINYIPSYEEMNSLISHHTNWRMVPSTELVSCSRYYKMLTDYKFPANLKIRPFEQIDYYKDEKPDVVHEYFGHGPFLIHKNFSEFMHRLAAFSLTRSPKEQILLSRLFWFTIEFGLIQTEEGLRVYGAGIIPSEHETQNALYGNKVERRRFHLVDILRTPIHNSLQKIYYIIESFDSLFTLTEAELSHALAEANYQQ